MRVADILHAMDTSSHAVITTKPDTPIDEANALMQKRRIGALAVKQEDLLVGILSERDVAKGLHTIGPDVVHRPVSDLMTKDVITCGPETNVGDAVEMMISNYIRHLPVLEDDTLIWIISMRDIVRFHITRLALENETLLEQVHALAAGEKLG